jgi:prophage DNA circulation protein
MAWKDKLLEASFRGIIFDAVKTDDSADRALAEQAYPYVDGSDFEDMGRGARRISIDAVFYGDDYEVRLNQFLRALDGYDDRFSDPLAHPDAYLVHPVFGNVLVKVGKHTVHHDADSVDEAMVIIDFVESTPGKAFFSDILPVQKAEAITQQGATAVAAASEAAGAAIDRVRAANPLAALGSLRSALTAPLLGLADKTNLVLSGLDVLAYPRAWGNDVSALVNGLLDVRDWGAQLQADWASVQSDLNSFSIFSSQSSSVPPQVTSDTVPTEAQAVAVAATSIQINVAVGLANAAGFVLASEAGTPTLTPNEIEAISNTARAAIEAAIAQVRITYGIEQSRTIIEPLKDQALALQEAARAIIAVRPPLIRRTAEAPGNMRLLAHLWYGDSDRAPELYRLNSARSVFVNPGEVLNAYAS